MSRIKKHRPSGRLVAIWGAVCLGVASVVSATVPAQTYHKYMVAKAALNSALQQPCLTVEQRVGLRKTVEAAQDAIQALIDKDNQGLPFPRPPKLNQKLQKLEDEITALDKLWFELQGPLQKALSKPFCPPPVQTPPPPPPPPNPPVPDPPKPPIVQVTKQPHHRSTTCPDCVDLARELNDASDSLIAAEAAGAPNQVQILAEVERLGDELNTCESKCPKPAQHASIMKRTSILAAIGGGAVTGIAITHAGGSDTPPSASTGTTIPSFLPFAGTLTGPMTLATDARTCAGSSEEYTENATVSLDRSGTGTLQLQAAFMRVYHLAVAANNTFTDNETFTFLGQPVPSGVTGSFTFASASSGTLTLQESTTFGSCTNTYRGTLR
jgi:hypothetical protein